MGNSGRWRLDEELEGRLAVRAEEAVGGWRRGVDAESPEGPAAGVAVTVTVAVVPFSFVSKYLL